MATISLDFHGLEIADVLAALTAPRRTGRTIRNTPATYAGMACTVDLFDRLETLRYRLKRQRRRSISKATLLQALVLLGLAAHERPGAVSPAAPPPAL